MTLHDFAANGWISSTLSCNLPELNLDVVFCNGQTFRWTKDTDGIGWVGVSCHRLWHICRLNDNEIGFKVLHNFCFEEQKSDADALRDYFRLDVDLEQMYQTWSSRDKHFAKLLTERREMLQGIRILRQDPLETLFAFICSTNNNVPRISKMVEKLCLLYGASVETNSQHFYDFPTIAQMAAHLNDMEKTLREAGFGYRARSIAKTVEHLANGNLGDSAELWLHSLRKAPYQEAKLALMKLPGVGPKVADCICLMALDKHQVVPVDRHVFNLTAEVYMPKFMKDRRTLSKAIYDQIGAFFVDLHGDYAGWAHSVLFSTRLRHFLK